ncbi:MAG: biotin/lipoyl-binding protein [Alistipes sp.]
MKKSNVIGLTIGIVVVIVTVSLICWFAIKPVPTLIQGEVEVKSIKISSKLAGRIEQMDVKEGQQVKKGELLFVLSTPEVEANCVRPRRPATRPARRAPRPAGAPASRRSRER